MIMAIDNGRLVDGGKSWAEPSTINDATIKNDDDITVRQSKSTVREEQMIENQNQTE